MMTVNMHVDSKTLRVDIHDNKCEAGPYTVMELSHVVSDGAESVTVFVEPKQLLQIRDAITVYFARETAAEAAGR